MGKADGGQMLYLAVMLAVQGLTGSADGASNGSHHQPWTADFQVPTTTNVTLDGSVATATLSLKAELWEEAFYIIPEILGICPQGTICWKAFVGGVCLANTTIQPSNSNQMGFLGQASFDYINTLSASTFYAAVADYQGSHLCKAAPSEGVLLRTPTSVTLASNNISTLAEPMTFNITLTRDASNGQPLGRRLLQGYVPLGGQSINVGFGDGTSNVTVTTASDGTASVLHTFAASGTYNTIATYAGSGQYLPSNTTDTIEIAPNGTTGGNSTESTVIQLEVTSGTPIATEQVTLLVVVAASAAGRLADVTVTISYGDGGTDIGVTNAIGQATFTHTYAIAASYPVVATFAGDGTYLGSTTTTLLVVGLEPTNISVASSPNPVGMNQQTDFTIILTSGGSGSSGLEGKKISISYGDSNGDSTSTSSGGEAQFTHSYASDDTYNAIVTFAGDATYHSSSTTYQVVVATGG